MLRTSISNARFIRKPPLSKSVHISPGSGGELYKYGSKLCTHTLTHTYTYIIYMYIILQSAVHAHTHILYISTCACDVYILNIYPLTVSRSKSPVLGETAENKICFFLLSSSHADFSGTFPRIFVYINTKLPSRVNV